MIHRGQNNRITHWQKGCQPLRFSKPPIPIQQPVATLIAENGIQLIERTMLPAVEADEKSSLSIAQRRDLVDFEELPVKVVVAREIAPACDGDHNELAFMPPNPHRPTNAENRIIANERCPKLRGLR